MAQNPLKLLARAVSLYTVGGTGYSRMTVGGIRPFQQGLHELQFKLLKGDSIGEYCRACSGGYLEFRP